ncbi:MAG: LLM class flavin-dependent oxidoreductase [Alphaproteobacteria bacterium]|nr:LLM class flavin-dependent oxidoreductase [Alphaproteobacteria bacterium]
MVLPLDAKLLLGVSTIHRQGDGDTGPWLPRIDDLCRFVELVDHSGFDSIWLGDHISFPIPFLDPLLVLAQAAVASRRLTFGTGVYLLPLRHVGPVAKQVATLDHLTEGRLIFGVGVGGEFAKEYEVSGVPIAERGARLGEQIEALRALWTGQPASYAGRFYAFRDVPMLPAPRQPGGPPIWIGGRSDAALRRAGRLADGYYSYVVTPEMFEAALAKIAAAALGRPLRRFGTGHLLFTRIEDSYEEALDVAAQSLGKRYAMDFRKAAARYAGLGRPADVAAKIRAFHAVGVRHLVVDLVGPYERRQQQIERFAAEVMPLLHDLRSA